MPWTAPTSLFRRAGASSQMEAANDWRGAAMTTANLPLLSGGQLVVAALRAHGARMAFSVAGESYLDVLDALYDAPEIRLVTCRQEGGAALMAEAYGKLTGEPGVLLVTRGPGACNAAIGVHTAFQVATSGRPGPVVLALPEDMLRERRTAIIELRMDPEIITTRTTLSALRRQGEAARP